MRQRHLASAVMAGLIIVFGASCTTIETTRQDQVEVLLKVSAPYRVQARVNGKPKCTMTGTGKLLLKGRPGTCLAVGDGGVFERVTCP